MPVARIGAWTGPSRRELLGFRAAASPDSSQVGDPLPGLCLGGKCVAAGRYLLRLLLFPRCARQRRQFRGAPAFRWRAQTGKEVRRLPMRPDLVEAEKIGGLGYGMGPDPRTRS